MSKARGHQRLQISSYVCLLLSALVATSCRDSRLTSQPERQPSPTVALQQAQVPAESAEEKSCRQFVQDFYDWYFGRLNIETKKQTAGPMTYEVLSLKPQVLSPELRRMLKEDSDAQARNHDEIVGLDFDPFINAQDWEGTYRVEHVTLKGGVCHASMWGTDSGAKRKIVGPELRFENQKWIFVNFHYPGTTNASDENLINLLTKLRNDRKHPAK